MLAVSGPPAISRDDLYAQWYEWVAANLGRDPRLASIAATAATEAALRGSGFNSAAESARAAWNTRHEPSARPPRPVWRLDGAAALSIGCGFASVIVPLETSFTFPLFAILGILVAVRSFSRGRLIGGLLGVSLSLLGGIISLFSIWGAGGYI